MAIYYQTNFELLDASPKAFLGMAIPVAIGLGWELEDMEEDKLVFATPDLLGQKITVAVVDKYVHLKSKSSFFFFLFFLSFIDFGKNKENTEQFIIAYTQQADAAKVAEYEQRFDDALRLWRSKKN